MAETSKKPHSTQDTLALLGGIRLSASELAEARAHLLRADALADLAYRAWRASCDLARRLNAAVARRAVAFANAFAESAMRASERKRDEYLSQATDTVDLERRFRSWQARQHARPNGCLHRS